MEAAERRHETSVIDELRQQGRHDQEYIDALEVALRPFVDAFRKASDPGTSDLYDEQPFHITVTLGDLRRARSVL